VAEPFHLVPHLLHIEVEDIRAPFDLQSAFFQHNEGEMRLMGLPQLVCFIVESQPCLRQVATPPALERGQPGPNGLTRRGAGDGQNDVGE
jgi:hypothetical protein